MSHFIQPCFTLDFVALHVSVIVIGFGSSSQQVARECGVGAEKATCLSRTQIGLSLSGIQNPAALLPCFLGNILSPDWNDTDWFETLFIGSNAVNRKRHVTHNWSQFNISILLKQCLLNKDMVLLYCKPVFLTVLTVLKMLIWSRKARKGAMVLFVVKIWVAHIVVNLSDAWWTRGFHPSSIIGVLKSVMNFISTFRMWPYFLLKINVSPNTNAIGKGRRMGIGKWRIETQVGCIKSLSFVILSGLNRHWWTVSVKLLPKGDEIFI